MAGRRRHRHDPRVLKRGRQTRRDPTRQLSGHTACRQGRPESTDRDGGFLAASESRRRRTMRRGSRRNRLERRPCCRNIASVMTPVQTAHRHSSSSSSSFIIISYKIVCTLTSPIKFVRKLRILYGFGIRDADAAVARFRGFCGRGQTPRVPWL